MKRLGTVLKTAAMKIALVIAFALLAVGVLLAVGTPTATVGCGSCGCPVIPSPAPGYCQTSGGRCNCGTETLCAGWCLVDGGVPTPCDAGAE
jgi:hypothetical protein